MMKNIFALLLLCTTSVLTFGQTQVGEKWVDNNLTFQITYEDIKGQGRMDICIADTSRGDACIENLQSGFEVKVYDTESNLLWEGIGSGRSSMLKLPKAMPEASYVTIKAFKPYVVNKRTSTLIHQDENIQIKHKL